MEKFFKKLNNVKNAALLAGGIFAATDLHAGNETAPAKQDQNYKNQDITWYKVRDNQTKFYTDISEDGTQKTVLPYVEENVYSKDTHELLATNNVDPVTGNIVSKPDRLK